MKKIKNGFVFTLIILSLTLVGCGGGPKSEAGITTTSLGLELTDLNKAHSVGAITDKEYKSAKKNLINRFK
ncbi:MAG: hypothetical protein OCC45_10355 [Desulfotalea sp.]